jgi:hypothetical protein
MAFRRTDVDIPEPATFPKTLEGLGFETKPVEHKNNPRILIAQIVDVENGELFKFDKYEKHETNQQRYNAIHKAVRKVVYHDLSLNGVTDLYLHVDPETGSHLHDREKPTSPAVRVLSSPFYDNHKKEEVYMIVGDSKQDLGVLSRKAVLTEVGISNGSVLGLVEALRGGAKSAGSGSGPSVVARAPESDPPGIVILNPGELLWSYKTQECMSAIAWQDRKRENGFSDQYKISEVYNRIPGHHTPATHVKNCLQTFVELMAGPSTRLNIIAVGDGSEHLIAYLNGCYNDDTTKNRLTDLHIEIALIQPTHNADMVTNPALKELLAGHGRIWESHSEPKGTLLANVVPELRSLTPPAKRSEFSRAEVLDYTAEQWETNHVSPRWAHLRPTFQERNAVSSAAADAFATDLADAENRLARSSLTGTVGRNGNDVDENNAYKPSTCQRYSAGIEDTADMIFPEVMKDVLEFLKMQKERRAAEKKR